jgi:cathepsin A (carboxypeptidase C)
VSQGDADFICNWLGNKAWAEELEWSGRDSFAKAPMKPLSGEAGFVKSSGNFTFAQIHGAGHMVPYDQPDASLSMLNEWLSGKWTS